MHSRPFSGYIFVAGVQIRLCTPFVPVCIPCKGKNDFTPPLQVWKLGFFEFFTLLVNPKPNAIGPPTANEHRRLRKRLSPTPFCERRHRPYDRTVKEGRIKQHTIGRRLTVARFIIRIIIYIYI
jgi:hypothetical protein